MCVCVGLRELLVVYEQDVGGVRWVPHSRLRWGAVGTRARTGRGAAHCAVMAALTRWERGAELGQPATQPSRAASLIQRVAVPLVTRVAGRIGHDHTHPGCRH